MATLADMRRYFEEGKHGRPLPLAEIKELSPADREELIASLEVVLKEKKP